MKGKSSRIRRTTAESPAKKTARTSQKAAMPKKGAPEAPKKKLKPETKSAKKAQSPRSKAGRTVKRYSEGKKYEGRRGAAKTSARMAGKSAKLGKAIVRGAKSGAKRGVRGGIAGTLAGATVGTIAEGMAGSIAKAQRNRMNKAMGPMHYPAKKKAASTVATKKPTKTAPKPVKTVKTKAGNYPIYKKKSKEAGSFRSAFAAARKAGKKVFTWQGRKYTTKLKK